MNGRSFVSTDWLGAVESERRSYSESGGVGGRCGAISVKPTNQKPTCEK